MSLPLWLCPVQSCAKLKNHVYNIIIIYREREREFTFAIHVPLPLQRQSAVPSLGKHRYSPVFLSATRKHCPRPVMSVSSDQKGSSSKAKSNSTANAEKSPWLFPGDSSQATAIAKVLKIDISERLLSNYSLSTRKPNGHWAIGVLVTCTATPKRIAICTTFPRPMGPPVPAPTQAMVPCSSGSTSFNRVTSSSPKVNMP